jgi:hypothetical protein
MKLGEGVAVFAVGAVLALGGAALLEGRLDESDSSDTQSFKPPIPPAEFLYLDGSRILNYVAQLEGGMVGPIHRITKEIDSVSEKASAGGLEVGGSSQHEKAAESTLKRTESSELGLLIDDLEQNEQSSQSELHYVHLDNRAQLESLKEGWMVRFVTNNLLSPGYIRPYVVLRQSATLAALFPHRPGDLASKELAARQRKRAVSFAKKIGPDPRITFAVDPPQTSRTRDPIKVLLPMRYSDLTTERSLLEKSRNRYTGGKLVVIGKVVRVFHVPKCKSSRCEEEEPDYTDFATQETWKSPLEQASNYLIEHVSHSCRIELEEDRPNVAAEAGGLGPGGGSTGPDSREEPIEGRSCFLDKLEHQTRLYAPGAVILPLAVYK